MQLGVPEVENVVVAVVSVELGEAVTAESPVVRVVELDVVVATESPVGDSHRTLTAKIPLEPTEKQLSFWTMLLAKGLVQEVSW